MFTQEELTTLIGSLNQLPISSNVQDLRAGKLKINPVIDNLIIKLQKMSDEETTVVAEETPEVTPAPAEDPATEVVAE